MIDIYKIFLFKKKKKKMNMNIFEDSLIINDLDINMHYALPHLMLKISTIKFKNFYSILPIAQVH